MEKFYGMIGFSTDCKEGFGENAGIAKEGPIIERPYYGDIIELSHKYSQGESIIDDIQIDIQISIMADDYAEMHMMDIKYAPYHGILLKVNKITPRRPRLILTVGGLYNGPTPKSSWKIKESLYKGNEKI